MTPQERQMIDDLFDRLARLEGAPRDPDAVGAISDGLRQAPNAVYALVQTVLVQDEALRRANSPHPGTGGGRRWRATSSGRVPRFDARDGIRAKSAARLGAERSAARKPPGLEQRPSIATGSSAAAGPIPRTLRSSALWRGALRSGALRSAPQRAHGRAARSGYGGGGCGRNGRRIAAARRHPLDDGRRPSRFRRHRMRWPAAAQTKARGATQSGSSLAHDAGMNDIGSSRMTRRRPAVPDCSIPRRTTTRLRPMTTTTTTTWTWISTTISAATTTATTPDRLFASRKSETAARSGGRFVFERGTIRSRPPWRRH